MLYHDRLHIPVFFERIGNSNAQFSNAFGTRIGSGSDFEGDEVGWDLPLIQLENDLHPLSRYFRRISQNINYIYV